MFPEAEWKLSLYSYDDIILFNNAGNIMTQNKRE
jgi:hypothetical protein